jgi:hypothetical protein
MAMSEPFLEEQLRRIKQMSEAISEARSRQHELSQLIERERKQRGRPSLADVQGRSADTRGDEEQPNEADHRRARHRPMAVERRRR